MKNKLQKTKKSEVAMEDVLTCQNEEDPIKMFVLES